MRRVVLLTVVALSAAVVALGMSFLGGDQRTTASEERPGAPESSPATVQAEPDPEPVAMPEEIRGVHVTMALASLDGKLEEYYDLTNAGLNTVQLDVKDENGEVAFSRPTVPLARAAQAARTYYDPREAAADAEARGIYLVGRVVVFEDPILSRSRPRLAIQRPGGGVWTSSGGLGWTNPYDERVWKYNVDVAAAAVKSGFDEIMFDYVRFPTDGDVASAVFPKRRREHRSVTIGRFLEYARGRLEPMGARVSAAVFGLTATREMGIGQRPRRLARHLDVIYPMVYPSHYGPGQYGLDDPDSVPGITVARSLRDFRRALRGRDTMLVPWLQDFSLEHEYSLEDVQAQILAARDANAKGFLLWNPSGVYTDGALTGG
ncbi:MAG TPA: putative glycoside hydrolase [Gaiellaceae bacterium]|nr:putative glycoside hydrolase [Gaiellaceae bacterium]